LNLGFNFVFSTSDFGAIKAVSGVWLLVYGDGAWPR